MRWPGALPRDQRGTPKQRKTPTPCSAWSIWRAKRYQEGVVNYIEVLDAERSLSRLGKLLIQTRVAEVQNLVNLY